jgi:hypothetical protein
MAGAFWREPLFVPPIRGLKPARSLTLDDDLAVPRAEFYLAKMSARAVNLLSDEACALWASDLLHREA